MKKLEEEFYGTLDECLKKHHWCKDKEFTKIPPKSEVVNGADRQGPWKAKSKDGTIEVEENTNLQDVTFCVVRILKKRLRISAPATKKAASKKETACTEGLAWKHKNPLKRSTQTTAT